MRNAILLLTAIGLIATVASSRAHSAAHTPTPQIVYPAENAGAILAERKAKQLKTVGQFKVFYQFEFEDKLAESGITFENHIVDDAGKNYQKAHYDHGNGITVADVDGDGLYDIYFTSQTGGNELWKNLGKREIQEHYGRSWSGCSRPNQRFGVVRRHR